MHSRRVSIAALLIQAMAGSVVLADFNFPDFNSTAGLNLVGVTERVGNRLRLSPNKPEEVGAAWFTTKQQVAGGFETTFQFQITNQGGTAIELGADGFVFVIQSAGTAELGDFGGAIGYNGFPSVAVEFDTFPNPENNDPNNNHISVHTLNGLPNTQNHSASIGQTTSIADLSDGSTHVVKIVYVPGTLEVFLNNLTTPVLTVSVNIATALSLPGNDAYVGFTSATGLSFETHDILSWSFDGCADSDADQICDDEDNCPDDPNPTQTDSDSDSFGDACDNCPGFNDLIDNDGDSAPDGCDNCPTIPNPNQADGDNDNIGDCCDPDLGDDDADGVSDPCDNCPDDSNVDQADADFDGIGDVCDPCFDPPTQDDRTWIAGSGNWSNSAAWSPAGVPDSLAEAAFVPSGGGALTIGLDISPTIQTLMIGNADATLNLGGRALTVARCDGVDNSGTIIANPGAGNAIHGYIFNRPGGLIAVSDVQSLLLTGPEIVNDATITLGTGANAASTLTFGADVSLSGTGDILMPNSASTLATTDPFALTQEVGHLIHGRGAVSGVVTNKGTIRADISGQILFLNTNDKTNEGTLEAMLGSRMEIDAVTIDNAGGTIVGNEGEVDIDPGSLILEGSLDSVGAGLVLGRGGSVQDVTNLGLFRVADNNAVTVLGSTLTNNATIELGSGLNATARLSFASDVTVAGPGDIHMRDSGSTLETTDAFVVTNAADHLIHGRGVITGTLLNLGTVRADINSQVLFLRDNPKTNNGMIEALSDSQVEIETVTIANSGGTLLGDEGVVNLELGATIVGGTLDTVGAGLILGESNSVLQDVTNAGLFRVASVNSVSVTGTSLMNDGTIELGTGVGATSTLRFEADISVAGSGDILMRDSAATIATTDAFVVTNEADQLIHGRGQITGTLVNHGTIRADLNGQTLFFRTNPKTNDGLIEALGGSQVEIEVVTVNNAGGTLLANEGIVNLELGATVVGGTLDSVGDGFILGESNSVLEDVTNLGRYIVGSLNTNQVDGSTLTNNGTIFIGNNVGATTTLSFIADVSVGGSGEIVMQDSAATLMTDTGIQSTHAAGHTIRGRGVINADLVNKGTIICDRNPMFINPAGAGVDNQGTMRVINPGLMTINTATLFTNNGAVTVDSGRTLTVNGGNYTQTAGVTTVEGSLNVTGGQVALQGGVLRGNGTVSGGVTNTGGTTAPGSSAGKLTVTGNYTQSNNGVLKIEIGGLNATTEHDVLAVSGTATLGGELNVVPTGGFIPQIGQQFVILTANSVQQTFSTVTGPGTYTVQYNPGNVVLTVATVPCNGFAPADFDQDCDVDQDDIALFEACASGPAMPLMLGCEDKDFDSDNDTDQSDFGVMQRCLSGPNTPADLNCAD